MLLLEPMLLPQLHSLLLATPAPYMSGVFLSRFGNAKRNTFSHFNATDAAIMHRPIAPQLAENRFLQYMICTCVNVTSQVCTARIR